MGNKLTQTKSNLSAYDLLNDNDKLAVDMATNHIPYIQIAEHFKVAYQTVKMWFYASGKLHDALRLRQAEIKEDYDELFKTINDQIKDGAVDAIVTLRKESQRYGMTAVIASKDILDRAGFKPVDRLEVSTPTVVNATLKLKNGKNIKLRHSTD